MQASLPPLVLISETRTTAFMKWVSAYNFRVTRFKVFAHTSIIFLPVGIEPVKEIFVYLDGSRSKAQVSHLLQGPAARLVERSHGQLQLL